jgi:hypothetical protein
MASPYRTSAGPEPRVVVTRRVRGLGWPVALVAAALFGISYLSFAESREEAQLECPPAGEACFVTKPTGEVVRVPEYSDAQIIYSGTSPLGTDTYIVRLGLYTDVIVRSRDDAERFVAAFKAHHKVGAACKEAFRVGGPLTRGYAFAALGSGLLALLVLWRGAYRFVRDDRRRVLRVERARGLLPHSAVEVPLDDVAEIASASDRPDMGFYARYARVFDKAFARHAVVLRMRAGNDVLAFPTRLNEQDALEIARAASALLRDDNASA